jgi:hexosaminidase
MLDVSRHFFTVDYIKKHLDVLALYKINKFHWHLTDDHGWRIEIEKYPKLTEIGAWRPDRSGVAWSDVALPQAGEPATYGGYYTKAQVREIVAYAAQRNIEVIPEIEVPGHCAEVLAAYPHLACDDFPYTVQVGPYWPPKAILCGGNDAVLQFLKEVIDEVAVLFPSEYIHIGGDEALKENWKACRKCQQRIKDLHLQNEEVLQSWIIREVEKNIMAHGKKIIGWDEILDGGVAPGATVMYWRSWISDTLVVEAARRGNNIIMSPNRYCYFDYRQTTEDAVESEATNTLLPLTSVYAFDPLPEQLTNDTAAVRIKGGHANLWSELLYDTDKVEYMMLPRLLALSEGVWSPKAKKEWHNFEKKLPVQKQRLSALGYNYCEKYE